MGTNERKQYIHLLRTAPAHVKLIGLVNGASSVSGCATRTGSSSLHAGFPELSGLWTPAVKRIKSFRISGTGTGYGVGMPKVPAHGQLPELQRCWYSRLPATYWEVRQNFTSVL